ncbi:MAG TPA: phosphopantetheine-binding protein [Blastocatellia bacterium]|nr:phosphopantetheine-binding protein [Blastocatellia bacterium]
MIPERHEIEAVIDASIRSALKRDLGPITPDTSMIADLGVDSLELVEIVYGVEEEFDVEIAAEELFPQRLLRDPANVQDGAITEVGIDRLKEQFAFTTLPAISPGTSVNEITAMLSTVRTFTDYVEHAVRKARGEG